MLLLSKYFRRKNCTKLPGIGFLINSSVLGENDLEKQLFFTTFKKAVKDKFKVIIYEDLSESTEEQRKAMPSKYNLTILLSINEVFAKKNGEELYSIKIEKGYLGDIFSVPDLNEYYFSLCISIVNTMNFCVEIYKNNSYIDTEKNATSFDIQISYIIAIVYIISGQYDDALRLLDEISYKVNVANDRNINYIKKNLPFNYFATYRFQINSLMKSYYFIDPLKLERIKDKINNLDELIINFYKNQRINKKDYEFFSREVLFNKAIIAYDQGDVNLAIKYINNVVVDKDNSLIKQLNLAFLYGSKGNYIKSYEYYLKINQRKDLQKENSTYIVSSILKFVNLRLDKFPNETGLLFCSSLINIYFRDKILGQEQLKELITENNDILKIYNMIFKK